MNIKTLAKKKTSPLFESIIRRILPYSTFGQVLVWMLFPFILFLSSIGIAYLIPTTMTIYLPIITAGGVIACYRWRNVGIAGVYLCLAALFTVFFREIPSEFRSWHMGIVLSFAITSFIFLLSIEEIEKLITILVEENRFNKSEVREKAAALDLLQQNWQFEKENFEQEIEKFKEEAEQRRIEKNQLDKKLTLLDSEIRMLTEQKTGLIADAFNARKLASERLGRLEEQTEEVNHLLSLLQKAEQEKRQVEDQPMTKGNQMHEIDASQLDTLKHRIHELESHLSHSREEFSLIQEKTKVEKEALQEQIRDLNQQIETIGNAPDSDCDTSQLDALVHHIHELEDRLSKTQRELNSIQERAKLKSEEPSDRIETKDSKSSFAESKEIVNLKRANAQTEGLYKQLRVQFDEKSKILSQTRKELFHTQGKLLALEKDRELQDLDFDSTEFKAYLYLLQQLEKKCDAMEDEVMGLEELISLLIE